MSSPSQQSNHVCHNADFAGGENTSIPIPLNSSVPMEAAQASSNQQDTPLARSRPDADGGSNDPSSSAPAAAMQQFVTTTPQGQAVPISFVPIPVPIFAVGAVPPAGGIGDASNSTDVIQAAIFANMFSQMARYSHQYAANLQPQNMAVAQHADAPPQLPATSGQSSQNGQNDASTGKTLFLESDEHEISLYQCLVRQQIEVFENDTGENMQGRNRPVQTGQVGIRCRHCGTKPRYRSRGAILFPSTLLGLYQTAQNMANTHLIKTCTLIPAETRKRLLEARSREKGKKTCKSSYGGGRRYWADTLSVLGVIETPDRGLRFGTSSSSRGIKSVDTGYSQSTKKDE